MQLAALDAYHHYVDKAEHFAKLKKDRKDGLRKLAHGRQPQGVALAKRDPKADADFVADGLISSDTLITEYTKEHDRAVQNAIMYGIGALIARGS